MQAQGQGTLFFATWNITSQQERQKCLNGQHPRSPEEEERAGNSRRPHGGERRDWIYLKSTALTCKLNGKGEQVGQPEKTK